MSARNDDFKLWTFLSSATLACHKIVAYLQNDKVSTGTGFIAMLPSKMGIKRPFLVTNRHVIDNAKYIEVRFNRRDESNTYNIIPGQHDLFRIELDSEFRYAVCKEEDIDIALINLTDIVLNHGDKFLFQAIDLNQIIDFSEENTVAPLRSVCMIGCPKGLYDEHNNIAIARSGFLSSIYEIDFNSKPWFAIDIASYPGSSGSPIFEIDFGSSPEPSGTTNAGTYRIRLLGVLFGAPLKEKSDNVKIVPASNAFKIKSDQTINIAYCVKSRELRRFALELDL